MEQEIIEEWQLQKCLNAENKSVVDCSICTLLHKAIGYAINIS